MAETALRYDTGKPTFHLFPPPEVLEVFEIPIPVMVELGRVALYGAGKYGEHNWQKGVVWSKCYNAALRHLYEWENGERTDAESGCSHPAHLCWNLMVLFVYRENFTGEDDRPVDLYCMGILDSGFYSSCELFLRNWWFANHEDALDLAIKEAIKMVGKSE